MRIGFFALAILTMAVQATFDFVFLLYQPALVWVLVPCATLAVYGYALFSSNAARRVIFVAAAAIGLARSAMLMVGAATVPYGRQYAWWALAWGLVCFGVSTGLTVLCASLLARGRGPRPALT